MFCSKCGAENAETARFCFKCGAKLGATETPAPSEGAPKPESESSTGLSANVAGLLCYVLGWVTGIVFVVLEKKSGFVKFHAWQSIMTFGVLTQVQLFLLLMGGIAGATFAPGLWSFALVLTLIVGILMFVLWIILIVQAGTGKMWRVPIAGDWAEKQASK